MNDSTIARANLSSLLHGGFAPVVILLREFHYNKAAVILDGLPYSSWSLLEHMRKRQEILLAFMKSPDDNAELWPEAYWPENPIPENEDTWKAAINNFEKDLLEIIRIVEDPNSPLFQQQKNGKTPFCAAIAALQHNAYHIGQIKAIGRQLGVWH